MPTPCIINCLTSFSFGKTSRLPVGRQGLQRLVIINYLFAKFTQTNHAQTRCNTFDQIKKMQELKDWKEFINKVLIDSRQFENPKTEFKGEAEIETFKSIDQNSVTEIRVGYLKENLLIYLHIFSPIIPGYNKFVEGDYFHQHDFSEDGKSYGNPALEFNELNRKGIFEMLERGLTGTETQFILNGEILKSIVDTYNEPQYISRYDFTNRSYFKKLFSKNIEKMNGIEKREIKLNEIFSGIKNVSQQRV